MQNLGLGTSYGAKSSQKCQVVGLCDRAVTIRSSGSYAYFKLKLPSKIFQQVFVEMRKPAVWEQRVVES